jgi:xanthine dehydrogenase accessory factor
MTLPKSGSFWVHSPGDAQLLLAYSFGMDLAAQLYRANIRTIVPGSVLATLVAVRGSAYERPGAKVLFTPQGDWHGLISGGCLEPQLAEIATTITAPTTLSFDKTQLDDRIRGFNLGCEGELTIALEPVTPELAKALCEWPQSDTPKLAIYGAGPDVRPVISIAKTMGYWVEHWAHRAVDSEADVSFQNAAAASIDAFHVLMTHNFDRDLELLGGLIDHAKFVGVLGPKARTQKLLAALGRDDWPKKLHTPVGLDLGGRGAEAIALSIVAQIHQLSR